MWSITRPALTLMALLALGACDFRDSVSPIRPPLPALPPDLAADTLTAEGTLSVPYVMLELGRTTPDGFSGFIAVNGQGQVVWFYRIPGGPSGFTRRANGNFVLMNVVTGMAEVTPDGRVVHTLPQEQPPGRYMHHDLVATPDDRILFLANDWQTVRDTLWNGPSIWEWKPEAGTSRKIWSGFDFLDPAQDRSPRSRTDDWIHENALSIGPRGNLVVSSQELNQVISISPDLTSIEWRLNGPQATIAVDDPFSGQHTAKEIAPNRVLMFDNGFDRQAPFSRAAEYELSSDGARLVWQWRPPQDNWSRIIGSARRLANGNTLITFGTPAGLPEGSTGPVEVYEVTPAGAVAWHLVVRGGLNTFMYRATPLDRF